LVEILRREEIDGQRLDAGRVIAVARHADELAFVGRGARLTERAPDRRARDVLLVDVDEQRRASTHALEIDLRRGLSAGHRA
jgi:hypothetical protein